ncbi:MAG TPA: alpha/beta fold hydrolase [Egibacteraceae bacterium]|nr:alpha/beta fold hydrolase [Egibacteraceae bacterium]
MTAIDRTDTYCVIGAGSSGLTAAKNLREHGFAVDVYEREDDVGGNWNIGAENSRVYHSTHLISSKPFTEYPDFPMPDEFPDYPHHSQMHAYFRAYMRHFGLDEVIRFSTEVVSCEPVDGGRHWDVTVRPRGSKGTRKQEVFRYAGLVIANGHNWFPKIPDYPGEFTGELMHSAAYKDPEVLRGKRVLVVGAGNTGCDIAVEAAQNAARTLHSTRRGYWYSPKYSYGKPSDQVYDLMLSLKLPKPLLQRMMERTLKMSQGDITRVGLREPDHHILETHPIVNSQLVYYVGHGEIDPKPDIERLDGDGVVFTDGTREEVDLIVWCTGYLVRFPFIDHEHLNWAGDHPKLFQNVFHPRYDNLFVIGLIQPDSGQFKLVHWQSVAVARYLESQRAQPAAAEAFRRHRDAHFDDPLSGGVHYKDSTRHYFEINHYSYLEGIQELLHVMEAERPSKSKVMEPMRWAFPSSPVAREVVTREPSQPVDGRPPLLFVHGAGHGAWTWRNWMAAAAERGWASWALSLRGHGDSGGHEDIRRWRLRDYEHDVMQTIASMPQPPVLVGHSMGGLVVQRVLARYPARAGVLVAAVPPRHGIETTLAIARRHPQDLLKGLAGASLPWRKEYLFTPDTPDEVALPVMHACTDESPRAQIETTGPHGAYPSKAPVLVLGAERDGLVPPSAVMRTARHYGTKAHLYRGMGHDMMLDPHWRAPLDLMLDWLEKTLSA